MTGPTTSKPVWDYLAFQRQMAARVSMAYRSADQQRSRVRHKRSDGKETTAQEYEGQAALYDTLSTSSEIVTIERLLAKLDQLEAHVFEESASFHKGYRACIDEIRSGLQSYL